MDAEQMWAACSMERLSTEEKSLRRESVELKLPRFKIDFEAELSNQLKTLGASLPFEGADFSGLTASKELYGFVNSFACAS